ncbi:MAG TPA: caspase family protein [Bradyrhizobium sp.]|nr:caspase family protein [Bradyrhizobium sp.]
MNARLALLLTLLLSTISIAPSSAAGGRYALVIGNAKYPDADTPLKEPINDAHDLANELKREGFDVDVGDNLNGAAMRRALDWLYDNIKPGSVALIFFSGFGVQAARQTYMIPVDAHIWTEQDVRRDGLSLESVLDEINSRGAGVKIALIDASRRNPYERRFRSFSAGLAPVIAPNGTLVMYSAALSSVISDDDQDRGLFVQELLKQIRVPGVMAEEALNRTRASVTLASHNEQVPWISSSLAEDFSFNPGPSTGPAMDIPGQPPAPKPSLQRPRADTLSPASAAGPSTTGDPTVKGLTDRINNNPNDANALYRRGQVYASKGAYSLAIKDFTGTLGLNPKNVEAYNNRCRVRTITGDLQGALGDCNEALRLQPNFVDALDSRGLLNLKSGQTRNAISDFDAALKINPRLTASLYGRGLAKQRNGALAEGDVDINNAKAMDPNIVKEFASYGVH